METGLSRIVRRTRQHHAIEHATIHLLAARHSRTALAGLSDPWGFTLYGDVGPDEVESAVSEAILRLQAGEKALAIHPNCGTNMTTGVVLATVAALLGSANRRRSFLDRMASTTALVMIALFAAQPLGMRLQRYTTEADVTDRWLARVDPFLAGEPVTFRVTFR